VIELDGHSVTLDDVWRAATRGAACRLAPAALPAMRESRALVERLAEEPRAIYGINTGFGPLSGARVAPADLAKHQVNLLHHLSVGQGELFSDDETRAIMVVRANALARGYSGIREEVVALLLEAKNQDLLPEIPSEGSVGASGDLVPLAHMSRLLIGQGHARLRGERMAAAEALRACGLAPVELQCKEALALVNGTSVMTGLMALATREAATLLSWAEFLSACLIQALYAAPEVLCAQLHRARGHRGQFLVAERIASYLRTHPEYDREIEEHHWGSRPRPLDAGVEVQDPYSVRCAPQILGAFQDAHWHVEQVVTREVNATTDNPLFFADTGTVIHGGNFYGQHVAMVADYLRIGLIKLALLLDRQLERLVNWRYNTGYPPFLSGGDIGVNSGMAGCQLLATSLAAEARCLATPGSVQTIPTNANNQDVVSMGTTAAKMTRRVLPMVWKLLAIESLALVQAADLQQADGVMGAAYQTLHGLVRTVSDPLGEDRPLFEDIERVTELLQSPAAQEACLAPRPESPVAIE